MSQPIHVFLDSSAIRAESPTGRAMSALARLAAQGLIQVHVPNLVAREISSQNVSHIQRIGDELRRIVAWLPDQLRADLGSALQLLTTQFEEREQLAQDGVADWLRRVRAVSEEVDASMTSQVFDLYFFGHPPFKQAKNRNDLPDAFIFITIRSFASQSSDYLHVVAGDRVLRDSCAALTNVTAHETITHFLALPQLAAVFLSDFGEIREYCKRHENQLVERLGPLVQTAVVGKEFQGDLFPGYYGKAFVVSTGTASRFNFDFADASPLGDNVLGIPFWCSIDDARAEVIRDGVRQVALDQTVTLGVEAWASVQVRLDQNGRMSLGEVDVDHIDDVSLEK